MVAKVGEAGDGRATGRQAQGGRRRQRRRRWWGRSALTAGPMACPAGGETCASFGKPRKEAKRRAVFERAPWSPLGSFACERARRRDPWCRNWASNRPASGRWLTTAVLFPTRRGTESGKLKECGACGSTPRVGYQLGMGNPKHS